MTKLRIAINGFGRIGRQVFKAILDRYPDTMEVVAVNDLYDVATNVHLLQFDTCYGRLKVDAEVKDGNIHVGDWVVRNYAERDPKVLPWRDLGVDIVIESTGIFRTGPQCRAHIDAGARKVIITAPAKEEDLTIVLGVNDADYDPEKHHVVSNASCTTNCLAPVTLALHKAFGIVKGVLTTVHSYTNDQRILDLPHKDLRRARAAAQNIIPTSTGAAKAVAKVIPEMKGKFDGISLRVPTATVSIVDFVAELEKPTTTDELRATLKAAAEGPLKGIMAYCEKPLVSSDFIADPHSSIVDAEFTTVMNGDMAKVLAWYDNEWGYSCRVADLAALMAKKGL
ncbi:MULTISPECIES: type I glyceraldehyde-3-phosphate dehydrogenase [Nitratidesulfovibrio]|uniref:Glyceraldehyde-3-phosphate dehydrogenase n=1 Tax=Nitratidesulfovibrio oxamicus TaxID=32016 RepID=A0ABS0J0G2_9BACT|nr:MULTISPECIES: type I glyceraldehyde-3-phosphate dehydrogenase [Nitratidesulfovibrio]MBG3875912.1 type I glyceraldehyde-3-phosphate dehydrogenase [Nitratidesulfovibrio oxamicus]MBZ2172404.1 type I glyceraldehyde-3-phosphate dehydrogenase [Nitratidesulfovibrio sp. SRB-5]RXF76976.1 type I glyceraldehyde-3-phosphate dehydrogenase [Desulfovibrio sp. DS-1]